MVNHSGMGQELPMALSDPVVVQPWHSQRFTDLRKQVLKVVTFVRLLDADNTVAADESAMQDKSIMSTDDADDNITIHDLSMTSLDINIPDISMSSLNQNDADVSMVSAKSMMDAECSDGNKQN